MLNFNDLKLTRIRKTIEFNGETINILNPTKEVKEEIMKVVGEYSKTENNLVEIDINTEENPEFVKNIFSTLVEGINFPSDTKDFEDVMENPMPIVKQIKYEIENIIREICMERVLELENELNTTEDLITVGNTMKKLEEFAEKNKDINIDLPQIVVNDKKKKEDITPKPKAKPKRKSTKKKKEEIIEENKEIKVEEKLGE